MNKGTGRPDFEGGVAARADASSITGNPSKVRNRCFWASGRNPARMEERRRRKTKKTIQNASTTGNRRRTNRRVLNFSTSVQHLLGSVGSLNVIRMFFTLTAARGFPEPLNPKRPDIRGFSGTVPAGIPLIERCHWRLERTRDTSSQALQSRGASDRNGLYSRRSPHAS